MYDAIDSAEDGIGVGGSGVEAHIVVPGLLSNQGG